LALFVIADAPQDWARWTERQRMPAAAPSGEAQARGRALFESGSCAMCHAVAGTTAGARHAPDLTHVASRLTLAAGALPNEPGARAAWVLDPQSIKPGTQMPATALSPRDLADLNAFLGSLQ
jgi:cytochrome c oxidase subunit 2